MTAQQDRRTFLHGSLAVGAGLTLGQAAASPSAPAHEDASGNPRVRPGRVRWHESFAAACAAGQRSGKPVLLFQMMGRLDEKFC